MCIPSPAILHFRLEPDALLTKESADREAIFDDLASIARSSAHSTMPAAAICS
jgi:hypothetical protein